MPAKILAHPKVAPLTEFSPDFDLAEELTHHRDLYSGGTEWISSRRFPAHLLTCAERVKVACRAKVGIYPVLAAATVGGISAVASHASIKRLVRLRARINQIENMDAADLESLYDWFRDFPLDVSHLPGRPVRQSYTCSEETKNAVASLAFELGMATSVVAAIAVTESLSEQLSVPKRSRRALKRALEVLYGRVELRCEIAQALLKAFSR